MPEHSSQPSSSPAPLAASGSAPAGSLRSWVWRILGGLIPVGLAGLAFFALRRELSAHSVAEVTSAMTSLSILQIAMATGFVIVTYFMLSGYEVLAQIYGGKVLPYSRTLGTSFISFAIGNALGFNAITGGLVRLRLYSRQGFTALDTARITAFNLLTFWVGLGVAGGLALWMGHLRWPPRAPLWLPSPRVAGLFLLLAVVAYLFACRSWTGRNLLMRAQVVVPPLRLGIGQVVIGTAEWLAAAAVLWVLLPLPGMGFGTVLGVFVVSLLLGLISTVPGGLGVFETSALFFLGHAMGTPRVLGALLVYRIIFTLAPFLIALLLFASSEWRHKRQMKHFKGKPPAMPLPRKL